MPPGEPHCPFCSRPDQDFVWASPIVVAFRDGFPVSPGHTLVVPRRHVATYFDASSEERAELWRSVAEVKAALDRELAPDGYNVGLNVGEAAGQTVMHLHVHVIPRFRGDVDDPRGGVRGVIPSKQRYSALDTPASEPKAFARLPPFVHGDDMHFVRALRDALAEADRADLLSAFVQTSGVNLLMGDLRDALRRGAQIRLLAGDYLGFTRPDALRLLLALSDEHPSFSAFFFVVEGNQSFHPKAYLFSKGGVGVAYVGSSNLSEGALQDGIEWNLRLVSSSRDPTFRELRDRFEVLLASPRTRPLSRALIDEYELRAPERPALTPEPRAPRPTPNQLQLEALGALKQTRREGKTRALVVLATGLGKTYLSAFDFKAMGGERALFVAHREEILEQAKDTWQAVFPDNVVGIFDGTKRERDADLLFASVQMLSRAAHLAQFSAHHFDYIVVDEFHHAAAATYRKILGHFAPRFLLGLTATPERMDGRSLLDLCGDNLAFRRDLVHGISQRLLVPFHYFGVKDSIDFEPIPWRSGKFDATKLTEAVATEERADQALREYEKHTSAQTRRTLCFCCTVEHADFMAEFFRRRGKNAVAVHSGPTSAGRAQSLRQLRAGEVEILCAVDVFNEGLDVPDVNTVLMLRPTESPVIFLQQLGRGLRIAPDKGALVVIDFIGNHRSFLAKPQSLLWLLGADLPPLAALDRIRDGSLDLPEGCSIDIETEALDLLRSMAPVSAENMLLYEYMNFRDTHGRRPSASELFAEGVHFKPVRDAHESWFHFVKAQGDLTDEEAAALATHPAWFSDLLRTKMTKAYKMLAVGALLDGDALFAGMDAGENARRAFESAALEPLFSRELHEEEARRTMGSAFVRAWKEMPLQVWARGESTSRKWFDVDGDTFRPTFSVAPEHRPAFEEMTEEVVGLRLAEHKDRLLRRNAVDASQAPILLTVSHSNRRPILRFDRARRPDIPEGPTRVEIGGETLILDFKKIAVNVAARDGSNVNVLPEALRRLFGPATGQPGIRHRARLLRDDDRWKLEPDGAPAAADVGATVIPFPRLPFYPDVKVACGAFDEAAQQDESVQQISVRTEAAMDPRKHFVVRASGDSMDGGDEPIADGDLVLCEWTRSLSAGDLLQRPYLLVGHDSAETSFAVIKVPRKTPEGWMLDSWNPAFPPQKIPPTTRLEPVARVLSVVDEDTGLSLYGAYNRDAIARRFGGKYDRSWQVGHRDLEVAGKPHTVLMVTLRKRDQTKVEYRYADRFLSAKEFQWESQDSTTAESLKGRRIRGHQAEGRAIHLFVQYDSDRDFTYLGPVKYLRHEGEKPMRVRFELEAELPETLWRMWS